MGVIEVLLELLDLAIHIMELGDNDGGCDGGGDNPSKSGKGRARCITSLMNALWMVTDLTYCC